MSIDRLITAPADKVSGADFLEAIRPGVRERREESRQRSIEHVARLIERGASTYGYGPWYVEEAQKLIAEREQLTECRGDPLLRRTA